MYVLVNALLTLSVKISVMCLYWSKYNCLSVRLCLNVPLLYPLSDVYVCVACINFYLSNCLFIHFVYLCKTPRKTSSTKCPTARGEKKGEQQSYTSYRTVRNELRSPQVWRFTLNHPYRILVEV